MLDSQASFYKAILLVGFAMGLSACAGSLQPASQSERASSELPFQSGDFEIQAAVPQGGPGVSGGSPGGGGTVTPPTASRLQFAINAQRVISGRTVALLKADINLVTGAWQVRGQSSVTTSSAGTVSSGDVKACIINLVLPAADRARLRTLVSQIKICKAVFPANLACPAIGYADPLINYAEVIVTTPAGMSYLSKNLCLLAQEPRIKTLCADETQIDGLLRGYLIDSAFAACK